jgi:predicted O-linked N-acetylglucosamine transferase (SPINDLY family)
MSSLMMAHSVEALLQQAQASFEQNQHAQALLWYEQLIELEPEEVKHVWYYGLCQLLTGQEAEAQITWMMTLAEAPPRQIGAWSQLLGDILEAEAEQQAMAESWQMAWAIRQYIHELIPTDVHNLLRLVCLSAKLKLFDGDYLETLELTEHLKTEGCNDLDLSLLLQATEDALMTCFEDSRIRDFADTVFEQIDDPSKIVETFVPKILEMSNKGGHPHIEVQLYLAETCYKHDANNLGLVRVLARTYELFGRYTDAVEMARKTLPLCRSVDETMICIGFLAIRLRTGSCWQEVNDLLEQQKHLLPELIQQYSPSAEQPIEPNLLTFCSFYTYYLADEPAIHRRMQNQLAKIVQTEIEFHEKPTIAACRERSLAHISTSDKKLRIGYLARYMRKHSVGWLARWLMRHHDRDRFDIHTYHIHMDTISSFTDDWFIKPVTRSTVFDGGKWEEIATRISEEGEIDILVDLDSITYSDTCAVMAMKPAPIQVSWLGYDAPGLPAIDYFLADPYVLPESAQDYYTEKIWRLPTTYLAVDGFEIGVPTLRRDSLGIPMDAVIYLSSQDGRKRHPDMMRLQMKILREVPHSHLLIKGLGDEASIQDSFRQIAEEEGVGSDRLHFLDRDDSEETHRGNLGIADVVLDTYPYNGATTTLETLWVGVPLVTRVGQQWAARNSYAFMTNVGITEGIAWTDEEYVEWGVRLGKDSALRQQIRSRLLQSRQTAPLWNTKQFAREMEKAYEQMWQIYLQQRG